jgi:hypothetical protein
MMRKITVLASILRTSAILVKAANLRLWQSVVDLSEDRKAKHSSPVRPPARWGPWPGLVLPKQDFCQSSAKGKPLMAQGVRMPLFVPRRLKMSSAGLRCPEANSNHRSDGFKVRSKSLYRDAGSAVNLCNSSGEEFSKFRSTAISALIPARSAGSRSGANSGE